MPKPREKQLLDPENGAKLADLTRKKMIGSAQNSATIAERIRRFMTCFDLSRAAVAQVLCTPERTLDGWLDDGRLPPACMLALLEVIEQSGQARRILGVHAVPKGQPRGRPFARGNAWRFTDARRRAYEAAREKGSQP